MSKVVNKFLLAGNKFMSAMYLIQLGFNHSAYRSFTKNNEKIQKFKETKIQDTSTKKEADKACLQNGFWRF